MFEIIEGKIQKALVFAYNAHGKIDHRRKYTDEPYIFHCIEVSDIFKKYIRSDIPEFEDAMCACLLHDTVEDTDVTLKEIEKEFGPRVGLYVYYLTDLSQQMIEHHGKNRATRKEIDREHIRHAPDIVKSIKACDLMSNTKSIVEHDPKFAMTYLGEKQMLIDVALWDGCDEILLQDLQKQLDLLNEKLYFDKNVDTKGMNIK